MTSLRPPSLRYPHVVFDLDGTLVDSLLGIEESLRAVVVVHQPTLTLFPDALRPRVGPPLASIVRALWPPLEEPAVAELIAAYRTHYLADGCAATTAFPGAAELLAELHAAGARLFVLTNKPLAQTAMILNRRGWTAFFEEVACPDDPRHPFACKEDGAVRLRERAGLAPPDTLMVGDAPDDARAARAAGWVFAAAGYGYGNLGGHGSSLDENQTVVGRVADLRRLLFAEPSFPPSHDHPEPLR